MRGVLALVVCGVIPAALWADEDAFKAAYARAASSFDACKLSDDQALQVEYYGTGMAALQRLSMLRDPDKGLHDYMMQAVMLGRDACEKRYHLGANRGPR